jgi:hypothetical protein
MKPHRKPDSSDIPGGMAALEKVKTRQEAHGEIESHYPGYLGPYYVGTMKGLGRIYQ